MIIEEFFKSTKDLWNEKWLNLKLRTFLTPRRHVPSQSMAEKFVSYCVGSWRIIPVSSW